MKILQATKLFLIFSVLFVLYSPVSLAVTCPSDLKNMENTSIASVLCPASRVLSLAVSAAGAIFAIYVVYAGVKLALAWGDPKGFEAAKWSLTYSIIGFAIILGFFTILRLVLGLFGASGPSDPNNPFSEAESGIKLFENLIQK